MIAIVYATAASAEVRIVTRSETTAEISADRYRVKLRFTPDPAIGVWSLLRGKKVDEIGWFPLDGHVRSSGRTELNDADAHQFVSATTTEAKDGHLAVTLVYRSDNLDKHDVALEFAPQFFTYRLSVLKGASREITELFYLANVGTNRQIQYGRGKFEELRTWTPDLYDVLIPDVGLSHLSLPPRSGGDDAGYIRGQQAGSPLVPPYVVAIRSGLVWWGVGTVEIPNTYNGLGIVIGKSSFAAYYQTASQLSAQEKGINGPVLGFYFGNTADELLTSYRASLFPPTANGEHAHPDWWSRPIYCTWGDQVYAERIREGRLDESNGSRYLTEQQVDRWLAIAAREKLPIGTVILDLGWMRAYGDFEPSSSHFSDLRTYIDKLHANHFHVLLWIPMYEANGTLFNLEESKSNVTKRHPEWLVHTRDEKLTDIFDYTNPESREYVRSRIRYMLSSDAAGLNADGFKVDFIDQLPDPAVSTFHDPSWGLGEAMNAKVMELIYTSAKEAKGDALVESSFVNPLFQPWQDVTRLNDDVSNAVETYWWRAWVASVNGIRLIDGDDWWAMQRYFVPLTLAKSAWGIPNLYALEYRGTLGTDAASGAASGGYPVEISTDSYRQVKGILDVYQHAPADNTQEPVIDPVGQEAGRRYTAGPLKGFYAAHTLNFGRVLIAYRPGLAKLTSIADGNVSFRLPGKSLAKKVTAVNFDGRRTEIAFTQEHGCVRFGVEDSAKGTHSYEIDYTQINNQSAQQPNDSLRCDLPSTSPAIPSSR